MIHQEDLRHRTRSWSVSSMRAIPLAKQIERVMADPAMPVHWGSNRPGMQAGEELTGEALLGARDAWLGARDACVEEALLMERHGLHKQVGSRILQPWSHYEMVTTACDPSYMNFFALRCHPAAQPEMRRLAVRMGLAYRDSVPRKLEPGEWSMPYVMDSERSLFSEQDCLKLSTARCGRVSFLHHGEVERPTEKDFEFHDIRLRMGDWSIFEHQARSPRIGLWGINEPVTSRQGNLPGWIQYRQCLEPNVHLEFDFSTLDQFREDWPTEDDCEDRPMEYDFGSLQIISGEGEPR